MPILELARLVVDFALLVLIWLVQLTIYPSFRFVKNECLLEWHACYVRRMAWIAGPLILAQTIIVSLQLIDSTGLKQLCSVLLVFIAWILTYLISIPLHRRISAGEGSSEVLQRLVGTNWYRTLVWTLLCGLGWL